MNKKGIPRILHFIYRTSVPPSRYAAYFERAKKLHPSWKVIVWDDESAFSLVSRYFPDFREAYTAYRLPVQRTDILRVMIMYLEGGFYLDLDMLCLKSLDELCEYGAVLGVEKVLSAEQCALLDHRHSVRIANYMFGSRPGCVFWLELLAAASKRAACPIGNEKDVLETTGPGLLTNVFHDVGGKYADILVLPNETRSCLKTCGPASCHFGDFAAHLHLGSWRWGANTFKLCQ